MNMLAPCDDGHPKYSRPGISRLITPNRLRSSTAFRGENARQGILARTDPVLRYSRRLQARLPHLKLQHSGRQVLIAVVRFIWTIWLWRAALNELESLTDADFRDMPFKRVDGAEMAWESARRYVDERTVPTRFLTGFAAVTIAATVLVAAALSLMA
jgi:hypothetical protein